MLKNATYNLMQTAPVLSKGLYRYDTFKNDAKDCPQCRQLWDQMKRTDEQQLQQIAGHLRQHFDQEVGKEPATGAAP